MFSGGLDSTLAAKLMMEQGIELTALHLTSPFCTCDRGNSGCMAASRSMADVLGLNMITITKGKEYFRIIKNPRFGYGSGMNPCLDCRIFGLNIAKKKMKELGASFIVTGEVLGQRPMSQRRDTINLIERESRLKGLIVRPLSAKFFSPTRPEEEGLIDRNVLLNISGRSRKVQMELARDYKIEDYPCPAGGCLLTDKGYSRRVRDLFAHVEDPDTVDFNLLKVGRHLRLPSGEKLIVPRNEAENKKIEHLGKNKITLLFPDGFPGPVLGIDQLNSHFPLDEVLLAFRRYTKKKDGVVRVRIMPPFGNEEVICLERPVHANVGILEEFIIR